MPVQVSYPGVYIEELPSSVHPITGVATSITAFVGMANSGPVNVPTTINSYGDYDRIFGGLWARSTMSFAVNDFFANGGSQAIIVRLVATDLMAPGFVGPASATLSLPEDLAASPPSNLSSMYTRLELEAADPGAWANYLNVLVDLHTKNPSDPTLFNLTATQMDPTLTQVLAMEKYVNLSVDPSSSNYVVTVLTQNSALLAVQQDHSGDFIVPSVRPAATLSGSPLAATPVYLQGGEDGSDLTAYDFVGLGQSNKQGLYALEYADLFNILCIPPYMNNYQDVDPSLVGMAAAYCQLRRAFYIVDPPSSWTNLTSAQNGLTNLGTNSDHAAVYFPRVIEQNLLTGNLATFVPCGIIAGIYAATDGQRGVWKAPAGQETALNNVSQLVVSLTDAENGQLNPLGINCLRSFPVTGRVVWGARTLQGADVLASQWKYIPVRRTALYIEQSMYQGTQWVVFEPNDETLWSAIRLNIGSFMQGLFRQGAFFGSSPNEAYFVKCDDETTTQADIDNGIVNIVVGFAPLQPAEFVVIQIQQMAGQLQA
jgi:phage tail sheath protein FI